MEGILRMSQKEIDRLTILKQIEDNKLTVEEASGIIGISEPQTYRVSKENKRLRIRRNNP